MKGPSIVFAREGSALDGFEESPFGGDAAISWRRVAVAAAALALGVFFVWYVAAAPRCVRDVEARAAESVPTCQAALYDHLRLATVGRMFANALRR